MGKPTANIIKSFCNNQMTGNTFIIFLFICFVALVAGLHEQCTTPTNVAGYCKPIKSCQTILNWIRRPDLSSEDRALLAQFQCGQIWGEVYVCCPSLTTSTRNFNELTPSNLPKPPACGLSLSDKIFGGTETNMDEFPWMALIEYTKRDQHIGYHCGGALINTRYVLTAAHCVMAAPSDWVVKGVRLGEWDLTMDPDCEEDSSGNRECAEPHQNIEVEQTILHPSYSLRSNVNDIALLRLAEEAKLNDFVKPICIPTSPRLRALTYVGTVMDIAGWGATETSKASSIKMKAMVNVTDLLECHRMYMLNAQIRLHATQICAMGNLGVDTCKGDSGGPLMVMERINNRSYYFLVGIVSFGTKLCGQFPIPGVYTRVGAYVDWIEEIVRP